MPFWDKIKGPKNTKHVGPKNTTVTKPDAYWGTGGYMEGDHKQHCEKHLKDAGLAGDFEIVLPKANQLQLDYDQPDLPARFHEALEFLTNAYCTIGDSLTYTVTESRHGNRHVTIDLKHGIDDVTRIAWQSIFGSDFKRDGSSMISVIRGIKNPVLFFERKNAQIIDKGYGVLTVKTPEGRKFR